MAKFFGDERISVIHGRARKKDGSICIAMYHPAAGLHQASLKDTIRQDFERSLSLLRRRNVWPLRLRQLSRLRLHNLQITAAGRASTAAFAVLMW